MTDLGERVLVLAPRGRDAALTCAMFTTAGLDCVAVPDGRALAAAIREGAGCAVLTSDVLDHTLQEELAAMFALQPPWSDFPLIVLTSGRGAERDAMLVLGNMTMLERPIAPGTLLTAVRAAVRGRRRQYDSRAAIHLRDQFLAMLGHELRNPLAAITLAAEPPPQPLPPEALVRRLGVISRQARHLGHLVDDLLEVSRVTSGKVQLRRQAVDLDATLREVAEAQRARAEAQGLELVVAPCARTTLEGDEGRLSQVFGNLVSNAIKYSPAGGTILVSSSRRGDWCEVRVTDQGVGIAAEILPRVFELFVQADASLDRADGGMGIGLALVDRLVRLHGGTVEVHSDGAGKGSEFVVRLPIGEPPPVVAEPARLRPDARPLHVVIVEDNLDLLALTQDVVESLGCTTAVATDGEEGVTRILEATPDLALIDVGLPKLDGFGVVREVRQRHAHPPTMVAVTGYGQAADRQRALASGFDEHVVKPVHVETLRALIDRTRARLSR